MNTRSGVSGRGPVLPTARRARRGSEFRYRRLHRVELLEERALLNSDLAGPGLLPQASILPDRLWQAVSEVRAPSPDAQALVQPDRFAAFSLDTGLVRSVLAGAPLEFTAEGADSPLDIAIPTPEGAFSRFLLQESPVMAPELASQFPEIKTYSGPGLDDPAATCRLDVTPAGFHAQVLSPSGDYYIDPYWRLDDGVYASYFKSDLHPSADAVSAAAAADAFQEAAAMPRSDLSAPEAAGLSGPTPLADAPLARSSGTQLRTYRLAVAATGEYTAYFGGTVAAGQAAIVTAVNRVTGIYERDLSIRLQLVANNSLLVYTNPATDPYSNNNSDALLTQNQANIDSVIGNANYDIGHVFSTGGGGLAYLEVVGKSGSKAMGETGSSSPTGDAFYVDYVAHEMGHQFGANHSFNGVNGSAAANRKASAAYEPGSGSTIMSYAGICDADDLQAHSDDYFLFNSFEEIIAYVDGSIPGVGTKTATGNTVPTVNAGPDYTIPARTPYTMIARDGLAGQHWDMVYGQARVNSPLVDGGTDKAYLTGTTGDDTLIAVGKPHANVPSGILGVVVAAGSAQLSGTGYWIQAQGFQETYADLMTGNKDVANLYDSNDTRTDQFWGNLHDAVLSDGTLDLSNGNLQAALSYYFRITASTTPPWTR
jgi:hypothetical protein